MGDLQCGGLQWGQGRAEGHLDSAVSVECQHLERSHVHLGRPPPVRPAVSEPQSGETPTPRMEASAEWHSRLALGSTVPAVSHPCGEVRDEQRRREQVEEGLAGLVGRNKRWWRRGGRGRRRDEQSRPQEAGAGETGHRRNTSGAHFEADRVPPAVRCCTQSRSRSAAAGGVAASAAARMILRISLQQLLAASAQPGQPALWSDGSDAMARTLARLLLYPALVRIFIIF